MPASSKSPASPIHPFAMLLAPEAVLIEIDRSERLARLQRRICRPLDTPRQTAQTTPVHADDDAGEQAHIETATGTPAE